MKDYDKIKTIADAVLRLRRAFIAAGMSSPVSIELGSRDDEYALKHLMRPDLPFVEPYIATDDPDCVGKIVGMKVLRPRATPLGRSHVSAMEGHAQVMRDYHDRWRS